MFTGIVEQIGMVEKITSTGDNKDFIFSFGKPINLNIGDSVAVNGVCLTLTAIDTNNFSVTAIPETLRLTNLSLLQAGDPVNLETALTANRSMGGHYVQGHVDGMAKITQLIKNKDNWECTFACDADLAKYIRLLSKPQVASS
jgi:riboflavin synthase